jgi:hypothetical protein
LARSLYGLLAPPLLLSSYYRRHAVKSGSQEPNWYECGNPFSTRVEFSKLHSVCSVPHVYAHIVRILLAFSASVDSQSYRGNYRLFIPKKQSTNSVEPGICRSTQ